MDRERALELIYEAIDIVNQQLPSARRLARSPATVIVGPGGSLDSLGIVTFVLALEEHAGEAFGRPVPLLNPEWLGADDGPFRTVDSLLAYLMALQSS
jgi:D-alanine--poly(phosphoribitol) ligase subunit 2